MNQLGLRIPRGSIFLTTLLLAATANASGAESPLAPDPNQREIIEQIFAQGGDVECSGGLIHSIVLRDASDGDFVLLNSLAAVNYLDCSYCKIDGRGLAHIAQMKQLKSLWLHDNEIKDEHLKHIGDLPRLHTLWLENTPITDAGLQHVRHLTSLERLYLANTKITDNGLAHLRALKNLKTLDLSGTKVTQEGIADLRKHLPQIEIWRE